MSERIQRFNEYNIYDLDKLSISKLTEEESEYVISTSISNTNIDKKLKNYFIFIGYNPVFKTPRVKICETDSKKCFVILLKTFEVIGDYDESIITEDIMARIRTWLKINMECIWRFSTTFDFTYDQFEFVADLKKI